MEPVTLQPLCAASLLVSTILQVFEACAGVGFETTRTVNHSVSRPAVGTVQVHSPVQGYKIQFKEHDPVQGTWSSSGYTVQSKVQSSSRYTVEFKVLARTFKIHVTTLGIG